MRAPLCQGIVILLAFAASVALAAERAPGVMRIGMPQIADTLDPVRTDILDPALPGIYDTLYALDPLARPAAIVPLAADALPEISSDYRTFTVRVKAGIFFTPHASFGGTPRELTAADFAYAIRRVFDPGIRSPWIPMLEGKIEGLDALGKEARDQGRRLDYDAPIAGLEVLDRYTLRFRLTAPDPVFGYLLAHPLLSAVPREVIEAEGEGYGHRPVGTGAFVVAAFTPGHRLILSRNPGYRRMRFDDLLSESSRAANRAHPMLGRSLPGVERLEFTTLPEASAEVLAMRAGELDMVQLTVPELVTANGRLREEFVRERLAIVRAPTAGLLAAFFNLRDRTVGGNAEARIALRRAIWMGIDDDEWVRLLDGGISSVRRQFVPPGVEGYVADYRSPIRFDPQAANALLDRYGYRRARDGMRRNPDGSELVLHVLSNTSTVSRKRSEFVKRMLDRIGIRAAIEYVTAGEQLKRLASCRFGMTWMEWTLDVPDGINPMIMFYSKSIGSVDFSCYADPEFDAAYRKALTMPPGPVRTELFRAMQSRLDAFGPARPLPYGDVLMLKRTTVDGPFGTFKDPFLVTTMSFAAGAATSR